MSPDHYEILGVDPHAPAVEIRAAYLRVMRENHPDRRPGDPVAAERARAANLAWRELRDPVRRASYDRLRVRRPDGTMQASINRVDRPSAPHPAYSEAKSRIARDFDAASMRIAMAVFALGWLLLFVVR